MEELWREVSELMWARPLLWVPVLVADLLGSLVSLGRGAIVRAYLLHHLQYHSVLGGEAVRASLDAGTLEAANTVAILITWTSYFLRMLLYTAALITTAALVRSFADRVTEVSSALGTAVRRCAAGGAALALRALPIYAAAAVVTSLLVRSLTAHGHKAIATNFWLGHTAELVLLAALAFLLPGAAVRLLAAAQPSDGTTRVAQFFALLCGIASLFIGAFVGANGRSLLHLSPGARFPLEATGSLLVALPFVPMFIGLSLLAVRTAREAERA